MGVGSSDLDWGKPEDENRDMWGYKGGMTTPPQHVWSEFYLEGFPSLGRGARNQDGSVPPKIGLIAQDVDRLTVFGGQFDENNNKWTTDIGKQGTIQNQAYPLKFGGVNGGGWGDAWKKQGPDAKVCTPENYPVCSMSRFRAYAPTLYQWQSKPFQGYHDNETGVTTMATEVGDQRNMMNEWLHRIDDMVTQYQSGAFDGLRNVNDSDTRNWDPCSEPGTLETVLPLGTAAVLVYLVRLIDLTSLVGAQEETLLQLSAAALGFHVGKFLFAQGRGIWSGDKTEEEELRAAMANDVLFAAASLVAIPVGSFLSDQLSYNYDWATPRVLEISSAVAAYLIFRNQFSEWLIEQIRVGGYGAYPITFLLSLVGQVEKFFCRAGNWGQQACMDTKRLPYSRYWDVGSLAAMLVDSARDETGWSRDDPRTEFVYRGLLTTPAFLYAGTEENEIPGLYHTHLVNPIGLIMPVETDAFPAQTGLNRSHWVNWYSANLASWTGDFDVTKFGVGDFHLRYACQNFQVLMEGDEKTVNTKEEAVDALVASNLKKWVNALVAKAQDPSYLVQQKTIPGLQESGYTFPKGLPVLYGYQKYLKTCADDYEPVSGYGFDTLQSRGIYAGFLIQDEPPVRTAAWTELEANQVWDSSNLETGWGKFDIWDQQNQIALAHYIYADKGENQADDFVDNFEQGFMGVRAVIQAHPENPGFTASPFKAGGFLPLKPLPVQTTTCLDAAQAIKSFADPDTAYATIQQWKPTLPKLTPYACDPQSLATLLVFEILYPYSQNQGLDAGMEQLVAVANIYFNSKTDKYAACKQLMFQSRAGAVITQTPFFKGLNAKNQSLVTSWKANEPPSQQCQGHYGPLAPP